MLLFLTTNISNNIRSKIIILLTCFFTCGRILLFWRSLINLCSLQMLTARTYYRLSNRCLRTVGKLFYFLLHRFNLNTRKFHEMHVNLANLKKRIVRQLIEILRFERFFHQLHVILFKSPKAKGYIFPTQAKCYN